MLDDNPAKAVCLVQNGKINAQAPICLMICLASDQRKAPDSRGQ
jgi:hypothetical protein